MTVAIRGPLFDGRADAALDAFMVAAEDVIAQRGRDLVLSRLGQVLQHPTGHYQGLIQTNRVEHGTRIWDGGQVVYGPWLEGVGSRNYPKTVFRGYRSFRIVGQRLRAESGAIAEVTLPPFLARME